MYFIFLSNFDTLVNCGCACWQNIATCWLLWQMFWPLLGTSSGITDCGCIVVSLARLLWLCWARFIFHSRALLWNSHGLDRSVRYPAIICLVFPDIANSCSILPQFPSITDVNQTFWILFIYLSRHGFSFFGWIAGIFLDVFVCLGYIVITLEEVGISSSVYRERLFLWTSVRLCSPCEFFRSILSFSWSFCNLTLSPQDTARLVKLFPNETYASKMVLDATSPNATGLHASLLAATRSAPGPVEEHKESNQPTLFRFPMRILVGTLFACTMSIILTLQTYLVIPQITSYLSNVDVPVRCLC